MDKLDFEILKLLCEDARTPLSEVSKKLGVDTKTVLRRIKKLQKNEVILGSTVVLSTKALGFTELAGFFIHIKTGTNSSIVKDKLINIPQLVLIGESCGYCDFYAEAFLKDLSELHDVYGNLTRIEEINEVDLIIFRQQDFPLPYSPPILTNDPWLSPKIRKK